MTRMKIFFFTRVVQTKQNLKITPLFFRFKCGLDISLRVTSPLFYPLLPTSSSSSLHKRAKHIADATFCCIHTQNVTTRPLALRSKDSRNGFSPVHVRVSRRHEQSLFEGVLVQENCVQKGLDHDARDGIHDRRKDRYQEDERWYQTSRG